MGFQSITKKKLEIKTFQFPLWDSKLAKKLAILYNNRFQFPLWDSFRGAGPDRWPALAFNSLYGIHLQEKN